MFKGFTPQSNKKEISKIIMPEELQKIIKPKSQESLKKEASPTKGGVEFYKKEIEMINDMIIKAGEKGLNTKGLEKRREDLEKMLGTGHA